MLFESLTDGSNSTNIKQFGNKSCWFRSPSEHSGRFTQTMLNLTKLPDGERSPFHLRKPTSRKYFNPFLKEQKITKQDFLCQKGQRVLLFWAGNPERRDRGGNSLWVPATKRRDQKCLLGHPQQKETIICCLYVSVCIE